MRPLPKLARFLSRAVFLMSAVGACAAAQTPAPVVTILGDSITAGLGLPAAQALPAQLQTALQRLGVRAEVRGAGVSGDTSAGGLARVDFSVAADTTICIIELGANDYLQSIPPSETARNLAQIVHRLQARRIRALLAGPPRPTRAAGPYGREFFALYARVAAEAQATVAPDFLAGVEHEPALRQADGLHPNAAGILRIAARLAPSVARTLGGAGSGGRVR